MAGFMVPLSDRLTLNEEKKNPFSVSLWRWCKNLLLKIEIHLTLQLSKEIIEYVLEKREKKEKIRRGYYVEDTE